MTEKDRNIRPRDKEIRVKVSDQELQYAKDKAKYCGLSMSEYIRKQIIDGVVIKYEKFDIKALGNELSNISLNINQIARHVNQKGDKYDREDINKLISEVNEMQKIIYKNIWGVE